MSFLSEAALPLLRSRPGPSPLGGPRYKSRSHKNGSHPMDAVISRAVMAKIERMVVRQIR